MRTVWSDVRSWVVSTVLTTLLAEAARLFGVTGRMQLIHTVVWYTWLAFVVAWGVWLWRRQTQRSLEEAEAVKRAETAEEENDRVRRLYVGRAFRYEFENGDGKRTVSIENVSPYPATWQVDGLPHGATASVTTAQETEPGAKLRVTLRGMPPRSTCTFIENGREREAYTIAGFDQ